MEQTRESQAAEAIDALFEAWEEGRAPSPSADDVVQTWSQARGHDYGATIEPCKEELADVADEVLGFGHDDDAIARMLVKALDFALLISMLDEALARRQTNPTTSQS